MRNRFVAGATLGALATLAMSLVMVMGKLTGVAPMPEPIPMAIAAKLLGGPKPAIMLIGIVSHIAYGATWAGILGLTTTRVTLVKGLGLGVALWLVMQLLVLPFLGWGVFGSAITPKIAVATLALHLIYGGLLGWLGQRKSAGVAEATS